jgi:hypothetical protein
MSSEGDMKYKRKNSVVDYQQLSPTNYHLNLNKTKDESIMSLSALNQSESH